MEHKHYIRIDTQNRVIDGFSDAFSAPQGNDVCINDQAGYQFRLFPGGEENPCLRDFEYGVPLYTWDGQAVVPRARAQIDADIAAIPPPSLTPGEKLREDVDFLLIAEMTREGLLW